MRLREEQVRETQLLLQRTNARARRHRAAGAELEKTLAEERPALAARARALYKLGELSYLRLLLSVDRPSDFFRGYRFVTALARRDNERIAAFRADLANLATTRSELERRTHEALALREELEKTRRGLDADRARKTELLTASWSSKETNAAYLKELEDAEANLRASSRGSLRGTSRSRFPAIEGRCPGRLRAGSGSPSGAGQHPKFDTYTIQNGIEIAAPQDVACDGRLRRRGRLCRPVQGLRPHGGSGPRPEAPHSLRPSRGDRRAGRTEGGCGRRARDHRLGLIGGARASTSRCGSRDDPKTLPSGSSQ